MKSAMGRGPALAPASGLLFGTTLPAHAQSAYEFSVLRAFEDPPKDPVGNVIQGSDGALYGTTLRGGANGSGVVFKIATDGTAFTSLHDFGGTTDGYSPSRW